MSDTMQFLFLLAVLMGAIAFIVFASRMKAKRIEKRREADETFRQHRGGGPR